MKRRALPALPFLVVLLMALVEFGQAWFYPPGFGGPEAPRPFGGAFRMALWLAATGLIALHLARRGPVPMARALAPFAAFVGWGAAVILLWSVDPVSGARTLVFWCLAAGLAAAAGDSVAPERLARAVALLFGAVIAASLAVAAVLPDAAHTVYGDALVVRGLFPHKNQFGWFAAIGLVWVMALRTPIGGGVARLVAPVLAGGLLVAGSGTALVVAVAAGAYLAGLRAARALAPDGARAALAVATATGVAVLAGAMLAPLALDALGRDPTLTGRTGVWQHYLATIGARPLTGYGTGLFSTASTLNVAIGGSVPGQEAAGLHSPHSLYIALVGETGLVGLVAFVLAGLHLAFVAPFRAVSRWRDLVGALAFAILLAGLAETRDGYAPGVATVALVAARAAAFRQERTIRRSLMPSRAYS
jgi:exopolysaccharide production protein ExoQ